MAKNDGGPQNPHNEIYKRISELEEEVAIIKKFLATTTSI